ncbi:oxidoreductase, 2OG-Fe(II) oxygenase family [Hyphomonas neptunium ATCC 15444]|uniref:PKHD-type hydroxylase HNE_2117 n=2 Tax=Hyphomonas TaxID=85 RepID=Y2117_HYPNA|nr:MULTISPECIES: Fe2+-dependent dioxygenase [Hyphomonas]Q0C0C9.1 RecName: Full=PKHD-type hydroxylase HNE_2117 [Hyphomonas neptunium ATCC 15444]ABI76931.1 oxidoreductase, 2OG-Fe(II) oxygenase family [Hyphomonas neptunium ATCC 15444]KCZ90605.1 2OG-Fe(II) oxygenase [Hyphomonas hirschiana VP5]
MLLHIPEVLNGQELATLRETLAGADWQDGAATAGAQAVRVKQNLQLPAGAPDARPMGELVKAALLRHPLFQSAALPHTVLTPRFNRYEGGGHYGNHVDSAIHADPFLGVSVRTDVSTTVFLNDPEDYDGGELIVEDTYGVHEVKLPAGDAILYPATSLHRVESVTRGTRLASFLWTQSRVRDDARRGMLFQLDMTILSLRGKLADAPEVVALTGHYHNLLRQWADA